MNTKKWDADIAKTVIPERIRHRTVADLLEEHREEVKEREGK